MKEFFSNKNEWLSVAVGIIISISSLYLLTEYKISMRVLGMVVFVFMLIIWRMWIHNNNLKQENENIKKQAIEPISAKRIINRGKDTIIVISDPNNVTTTKSYITLNIVNEDILEYVGTAYVTGEAAKKGEKQAFIVHCLEETNCLDRSSYIEKIRISLSIQEEFIQYLESKHNSD